MKNTERRELRNAYALPKGDITKVPVLDPVLASECAKPTKTMDRSLSRVQNFVLDAVAPLSSLLDALNADEVDISVDQMAGAVETALTLLGNASVQLSNLRRTKVLEEYDKNLLALVDGKETEFAAEAPMLFGESFPKKATDYLQQLKLLQRAKGKPSSSSVFWKAPRQHQGGGEKNWRQPPYGQNKGKNKAFGGKRGPPKK